MNAMNKYTVEYIERKVIEVNANSAEEAEVKAFESDAWCIFVEGLRTTLSSTNNPQLIAELLERDQEAMEALEKGLNGTSVTDIIKTHRPTS